MRWTNIAGWLTEAEGNALQSLVRDKSVLELGAYKGRSTACMAEVAKRIVSVDRHEGETNDPEGTNTAQEQRRNVEACGFDNVDFVCLPFEQLSVPYLQDLRVDAVFIDGMHDADSVERDVKIALHTKAPLLIFHDANYESVIEGAKRAGIEIQPVAGGGSIGVGERISTKVEKPPEKPRVVLVMPRYGPHVAPAAAKAYWHEASLGAVDIYAWLDVSQSIAYAFNAALAQALDWRDQGLVDHIAMQHADIVPKVSGWLDILWREKCATGEDFLSCVVPIKDPVSNPRTSTAIHDLWNPWFPKRYIHLNDRGTMPETFGPEHVCHAEEILSLNTGLWIADLRKPWWDFFNWSLTSRITRHGDKRIVQMRSEDWELSRFLYEHHAKVAATWKIPIDHIGEYVWSNHAKVG